MLLTFYGEEVFDFFCYLFDCELFIDKGFLFRYIGGGFMKGSSLNASISSTFKAVSALPLFLICCKSSLFFIGTNLSFSSTFIGSFYSEFCEP